MTTLTEIVATVVVHSSAAAFSHFGVTLEPAVAPTPPPVERVVARCMRAPDKPMVCAKPRTSASLRV
jgi:hypothetical protein